MSKKNKKPILFLDMDDTLLDFSTPAKVEGYNKLGPPVMFEPGFFENLEPFPGAKSFVQRLIQLDYYDIYILTKPVARSAVSYTEKVHSIAKHFPCLLDKIIMAQNKGLLKGEYLLDDYHANGKVFGGEWVEFDKKANDRNTELTYQQIYDYFKSKIKK